MSHAPSETLTPYPRFVSNYVITVITIGSCSSATRGSWIPLSLLSHEPDPLPFFAEVGPACETSLLHSQLSSLPVWPSIPQSWAMKPADWVVENELSCLPQPLNSCSRKFKFNLATYSGLTCAKVTWRPEVGLLYLAQLYLYLCNFLLLVHFLLWRHRYKLHATIFHGNRSVTGETVEREREK